MKSILKSIKNKKLLIGIISVSLMSVFSGCSNNEVIEPKEQIESNYGKALAAKLSLLEEALNTVDLYIPTETKTRKINSDSEDLLNLNEVLPADLSTVKRKIKSNSRNIETEEISLKEELESLSDAYQDIIHDNLPPLENLKTLDDVLVYEDTIYLGGGITIPLYSLEGIATIEYLDCVAKNGNGQDALLKIQSDIETIAKEYESSNARTIYLTNPILGFGKKWDNGVITYRWGTINDDHKDALIEAMNTWETSCDNLISFKEISESDWNKFLEKTETIPVIILQTGYLLNGTAGLTSQVGQCYGGTLTISNNIIPINLQRTCLHELGHVLGLLHEHQKNNRDNYIKCETSISYETFLTDVVRWWSNLKFPEYLGGIVLKKYPIQFLFWTIYIPYFVWSDKATHLSTISSGFDYDSIMLYYDFELIDQEYGKNNRFPKNKETGKYVTPYNTKLSKTDIETIRKIYKPGELDAK